MSNKNNVAPNQRLLTVKEVSERLGISPYKVSQFIKDLKLRAYDFAISQYDHDYRIPEDALSAFLTNHTTFNTKGE